MPRKVFFSFDFDRDVFRVSQIRNSNVIKSQYQQTQFLDHANWEKVRRNGDSAIKKWIDDQFEGSTVTCVLIGNQTNTRKWVHYEIKKSIERKNAILGIYLHEMKSINGYTDMQGPNPFDSHYVGNILLSQVTQTYYWIWGNGYASFGSWIENSVNRFKQINHFRGT